MRWKNCKHLVDGEHRGGGELHTAADGQPRRPDALMMHMAASLSRRPNVNTVARHCL